MSNNMNTDSRMRIGKQFGLHLEMFSVYYRERRLDFAIKHIRAALDCAIELDASAEVYFCKDELGTCLFQQGCYRSAFFELAPLLNLEATNVDLQTRFRALMTYIQAAQRIPVSLRTIQRAYDQVNQLLIANAAQEWRHEVLVHFARLEYSRGELDKAISAAREALALKTSSSEGGHFGQVWDFHFDGLVEMFLAKASIKEAEECIHIWRRTPDYMPTNRHIRVHRCLAEIARIKGDALQSSIYAETGLEAAMETDYLEVRTAALRSFLRARIDLRDREGAREAIVLYAGVRTAESDIERFDFYSSLMDYYSIHNAKETAFCDGEKWRRVQTRVMKIGAKIDEKLNCDKYARVVHNKRRC